MRSLADRRVQTVATGPGSPASGDKSGTPAGVNETVLQIFDTDLFLTLISFSLLSVTLEEGQLRETENGKRMRRGMPEN